MTGRAAFDHSEDELRTYDRANIAVAALIVTAARP
jgi:hypothetical protein